MDVIAPTVHDYNRAIGGAWIARLRPGFNPGNVEWRNAKSSMGGHWPIRLTEPMYRWHNAPHGQRTNNRRTG